MVNINILNGGDITITTGGSAPAARTATRVWYGNDENVYTDYEISGEIYGDGEEEATEQIPNVTSAKKIEIGTSATSIIDAAFYGCSITNIIIPDSVTSIGYHAFYGCSSLTSVAIPSGVTSIGQGAFEGCSGLMSVTIGNSSINLEGKPFRNCNNLTTIMVRGITTS